MNPCPLDLQKYFTVPYSTSSSILPQTLSVRFRFVTITSGRMRLLSSKLLFCSEQEMQRLRARRAGDGKCNGDGFRLRNGGGGGDGAAITLLGGLGVEDAAGAGRLLTEVAAILDLDFPPSINRSIGSLALSVVCVCTPQRFSLTGRRRCPSIDRGWLLINRSLHASFPQPALQQLYFLVLVCCAYLLFPCTYVRVRESKYQTLPTCIACFVCTVTIRVRGALSRQSVYAMTSRYTEHIVVGGRLARSICRLEAVARQPAMETA